MELEVCVDIAAAAERIWAVLIDVERWQEWTASITSIRLLNNNGHPFGRGSQVGIEQPKLPGAIWTVSQFEAGRGFVWESKNWGIKTEGEHWITPAASGIGSKVRLRIKQTGLLIPIFRPWISRITRGYMEMEARGLKQRCES